MFTIAAVGTAVSRNFKKQKPLHQGKASLLCISVDLQCFGNIKGTAADMPALPESDLSSLKNKHLPPYRPQDYTVPWKWPFKLLESSLNVEGGGEDWWW